MKRKDILLKINSLELEKKQIDKLILIYKNKLELDKRLTLSDSLILSDIKLKSIKEDDIDLCIK